VNINLVRDRKTGKPKGYCFLGYENQRSTVLAVDNFNGIKVDLYVWLYLLPLVSTGAHNGLLVSSIIYVRLITPLVQR